MRETETDRLSRMTEIETALWDKGFIVAGMDEVGRGPLAGPVATCCVSIPRDRLILGVNDSKKVSEKKREELYDRLIDSAEYVKTAYIEHDEIDKINILNATKKAMEISASGFNAQNGVILIDAIAGIRTPVKTISYVRGDAMSYMIAAASIIAKVERDRRMRELDEIYPQYGFARNKGYGSAEHIAAIRKYGPCGEHRLTFIEKYI